MDKILRESAWFWRTNPQTSKLFHAFHTVVDLREGSVEQSTKLIMSTFLFGMVRHPNSTCLVEPSFELLPDFKRSYKVM